MSENVGSVEIKLVLNRDDFDLQISTLAEQPPVSVLMRAGLDTKQLESDLKAIGSRTINVRLNTDAISKQLDDALAGRTVSVRLKLDATAFNDELRVLTTTNRQVSIAVSLDDRFDDRALDLRIKNATRDRTVRVFGVAEFTSLNQSLAALDKHLSRSLTPTVDDRALTQLNEHLSLKQQHWAKVREDLSKPIKPTIDESDLDASLSINRSPIVIPAVVVVDRSQIDALAGQTVTLRLAGNTTELKRDIDGITKARVAIGGTGTNNALSLNPFKFIGNIGSNILGGALTGVGMELSKSLGGGITKAIEGAISGTFGSTDLLGEILGKKLTGAIGGGINKSAVILKSLEEYVDKVEPETPEGLKRKRQIKQVISQVQEAPQNVADSLTREVGAREISREQFLRRGAVSDQRKAQDAVVSVQADTEYQDRARELAVSSARRVKLDVKSNKQIESKSERLGTIASDIEPLQAEIRQFSESPLGLAVSAQEKAKKLLSAFTPAKYSAADQKASSSAYSLLQTPEEQSTDFRNKQTGLSADRINAFTPKVYSPEAYQVAAFQGKTLPSAAQQTEENKRKVLAETSRSIDSFKPAVYSDKDKTSAAELVKLLPNEQDQKRLLVEQVAKTSKVVDSQSKTKQSSSDKAFEQLDREAGKDVPEFVPVDLIAKQNERLKAYKKLTTEGKLLEKDIAQLKTAKQSAVQTVNKDEFQVKLSDSFRISKPLEIQRAESAAKLEKLGNVDDVKSQLGVSRTAAETSLKEQSGNSLDIAKTKSSDASGEANRAEARRSNLIQARRSQFTESVNSNAPIKDVEALKDKLDKTESRAGRVPSLKVKATETKAALNAQLGKIAAFKAEISTTDDAIAEVTDLHARTVAEFNAVEAQANKIKGKAAKKEKAPKVKESIASPVAADVAAIKTAQPIEKVSQQSEQIEAVKAKAAQVGQSIKTGAGKVKDAVLKPDRNIDIDVDKVKAGAAVAGRAMYSSGLNVAKGLDAATTAVKTFTQSTQGKAIGAAIGGATTAIGTVAKTGYKIASGVESVALDLIPMGRSAKGLLKQTALPALAYSAVTHAIPGGGAIAGGLEHLASGVLGPVMNGGANIIGGQATSMISQLIPNVMGLQSSVISAATGLIDSAMSGAIAPLAGAATAILGGKVLTGSAGNVVKALPFVGGAKPSPSLALPPSTKLALPPATNEAKMIDVAPVKAPNLEALTRAQLYAVAKQESVQGVTASTKKADLIGRIYSNVAPEKLGSIASNIDSNFDRQGKPVKGYDTAKESAVIAQIKQQERAINDRIAQVKKLSGIDRINALESLNIESSQFVTQLEKLKGTSSIAGFSGPTMKTIGSTQGRVSASISSKPEIAESRDNRLKATAEAMRGPTYGRSFAELVNTSVEVQSGQAQASQPLKLARVARADLEPMPAPRRPFLDLSAKAAEFFGATPGTSIKQNLGAITRTDKARGMFSEAAIAGAGMLASSAASGNGSIAGGAASIGATLVTRLAIESGSQYSAAIGRLKQQESFLRASLIQKAKMLAGAAKEINLNKTGDAITGDIAGFTIGTAGDALKKGLAASLGMPMLAQLPIDAIAATILPGKVVSARQSFAVAKAEEPKQDNIIDRFKSRVSNLRPINNERLQANYSAFQQTYSKNNAGSAIGSLAPRLEVADKELKASGAEALYDVDRNVVMVSKALARALDQPVQSLAKAAQKLEPLTHEIQHSNQFAGGQLNVEQASMGLGTPLTSTIDPKNKSAIDKSVAIAASQNPGLNKGQLHKLEVDAYAAESRTLGTLIEMQANAGNKTPPLNAIGLKVSSVMDKVRNSVGDSVDNFRETVLGQSNIANISRTTRAYGQVDRSLGRRADQSSALADAAYDESRKRSINSETAETSAANTAQAGRFSGVARRLGLVPEGEARAVSISQQPQSRVSRIASEFQDAKAFVTGGIASVTSDFTKGDAKKLAATAVDARTLSADIGTSQAIATRDGKTDEAKSLGKLKRRVDVTADRAERVSSQDSFTGKDAKKISDLKSQFNEIYQTAGRPIPHPFEEMKGAAGGLIGNLRGVGLGMLALPFAAAGIGMAANAMKQFGSEAIQAAIASDRVKTALTFSTGSKSGGDRAYQYAADQASILGVDRNASIDGYSKLRASSKGKISEGQSNTLFEGVGAAATTLGLTAEDQSGVFRALGQVMSKGSVQAEQLRGEIGERLPGAFAIAARSVGMSEAQLSKAMEMGSISAEKFIPKFGAQLKQEFGPGAKDASQNLQSSMFRLSGATSKATEDAGASLAVPVKFGVDAAVGGLALLEQHGNTLMAVIGLGLANAAYTGMSAIIASLGGLKSMGLMALEAAGGVAGLGRSIASAAATVGPMVGQFLLINASIEIGKALFSAFTPDDMGSRFEEQANKIQQSLDDIEKKGSDAKKSLSDVQGPSKGLDIEKATFGLSNAVGIKKGDDVVKSISKPDGSGIADNGFVRALSMGSPIGLITEIGRRVNESNGGKGLATMAEVQFNKSKIDLADQGDKIYGATGKTFDSLPELRKNAIQSQSEQKTIDQKQVEKAKELSTGAPDKNKVLKLDEDIKAAGERRDKNNVGFVDQRSLIGSQIIDLKSQREGLKDNKDYTPGQKTELEGQINAQLGQLEGAKKQLDAIDKKFGGSVDIMGKFNVSLSEMAAKIEATAAVAKNAFNSSEVKRLEGRNANRGKDEFASQNSAVKQAENEKTRASSEFTGTKKTIDEINKVMEDPTVKTEISKIAINGQSVTGETSASDLEQAKAGRPDGEKNQIEKLIARRKAIDSLPELKKNELESDEKVFSTKSALALEKNDRTSKVREFENRGFEGKANLELINAQKGNKVNEGDVPVRQAEIGKISADLQVASIGENIKGLDALFAAGTISKEEYTKRSMDLRSSLVEATTKAAQAELAVEQAKNKRIIDDFELTIKKREVGRKEKTGAETVGLINAQKGNKINESDVAIKRAEISSTSAKGELSEARQEMTEVDALKAKGVITEQEYTKRKIDLRSRLVDATIKAAEAELAIEQAKNKKILADWERNVKARELATKRLDAAASIDLAKGQAKNQMTDDEVAVKKAENQGNSANASANNIQSQLGELDGLRAQGVITDEEYARRKMDLESQLLDAKVKSAEAELAIEQAKNRKIVDDYDIAQKKKLFILGIKDKTDNLMANFNQLNGTIQGEGGGSEARKREIASTRKRIDIADKAIDKDVDLRNDGTISQKEFTDRSQNNSNTLRSEEEKLVNLLIQERQSLYQKEHDALTRNTNVLIRGLELTKTRAGLASQLDGAKQGYAESAIGLGKAKAENAVAKIEANESPSKARDAMVANIRLQSLEAIQKAEMLILDLKEKQQASSLRQAAIEAQISFGKQKIAVSESQRKLKDALITGDTNQIANAQDDVAGQQQILGLEGEKIRSIETQNQLSTAKIGIDRQAAKLGMDTELTRARGAVRQAGGFAGGTQVQQNRVIGGGSFGGGIDLSALNAIGSQNNIKPINLGPVAPLPIFDPLAKQIGSPTAGIDRTVAQNAVPMALDDRNIVAAINKLGDRLDKLAPQKAGDNRRMPGYSDQLEAQTANTYART